MRGAREAAGQRDRLRGGARRVAGGVDVENPAEGSLGAPVPGVVERVRAVVGAERRLSVAVGDLPHLPGTAALAALGAVRAGADHVKVDLWGSSTEERAVALLGAVRAAVGDEAAVIAGTYADGARVPSRPLAPGALVAAAARAGVAGAARRPAAGVVRARGPERAPG